MTELGAARNGGKVAAPSPAILHLASPRRWLPGSAFGLPCYASKATMLTFGPGGGA
jgi:hypothetical protein